MQYSELQVTSNFSFLRGASHPHELVEQASHFGYKEIAITDRNSFAGIVRAHASGKKCDVRILPACRLDLVDGASLLAYPTNKNAYSQLCNLLTIGNTRAEKGECFLYRKDVFEYAGGIKFIAVAPDYLNEDFDFNGSYTNNIAEYREAFGNDLYIAASKIYGGDDQKRLFRLSQLAKQFDIPLVATNDVHYHIPQRRQLQDILTCIRKKCTIYNAGYRLHLNAERYLKSQDEMLRLFLNYPNAIKNTQEIIEACQFSLDELKYE